VLAEKMLAGDVSSGDCVDVSYQKGDELAFSVTKKTKDGKAQSAA
jgi:hypothetical protein